MPYPQKDFERDLNRFLIRPSERNQQERYTCGNCAAFPCHRQTPEDLSAGLCFQAARQCRQECLNYIYEKNIPARGGRCKIDNQSVAYCQECHIPSVKKSRL